MGKSGMKGKVYYGDYQCPTGAECEAFGSESEGNTTCWPDEVTKFTIVESVNKREYGHDKSRGCQDVVAGIWRAGITLDAMIATVPYGSGSANAKLPYAGKVLYLVLYPLGTDCGVPMQGYAMVDQVSYTFDQERGEPISYTASLSSKGPWTGIGPDGDDWGGLECACLSDSGQ